MKRWIAQTVLLFLIALPVSGAETLAQWADNFASPDVQYKILSKIFPGMGPKSAGKQDSVSGSFFFPTNGSWVRLSPYFAYGGGSSPYLVVSCMFSHEMKEESISATSYLLRDSAERPKAISAGYAAYQRVYKIVLPKLKKTFLLLGEFTGPRGGKGQWSAYLLDLDHGNGYNPRTVWKSPPSAKTFRMGFDALGKQTEALVFQTSRGGNVEYSAYRWNGNRFEPESFASGLKDLPDSVWQYGTLF